jgi:sugar/nucleoside kinase (ribokinase family)
VTENKEGGQESSGGVVGAVGVVGAADAVNAVDVALIGDALIDYQYWVDRIPPAGGDEMISMSNKCTGGSAANTAAALGQHGVKTSFCGRIGNDENGQWIKDRLSSAGVDVSCMQYSESTGYVLSIIDANRERTMLSYRGASADPLEWTPGLHNMMSSIKLLVISGYSLMNSKQASLSLSAVKEARKAGALAALDPSPIVSQIDPDVLNSILSETDIIFPNAAELLIITGSQDIETGIRSLLTRVPCIGLKMGSEGSIAAVRKGFVSSAGTVFSEDMIISVSALPVSAIDTTGAGDAFNAGFIASMLQGEPPHKWLEYGNRLAAKVVAQKGASL